MESLSLEALAADADGLDAAAAATPSIDTFCSSAAWALAAAGTLTADPVPWLRRGTAGYLVCQRQLHPNGFPYLAPLEMMWGLQSPMVGADSKRLAAEAVDALETDDGWEVALWPGLAVDGPQLAALSRGAPRSWRIRVGPTTTRHIASLEGGIDGFLSRRSANFKKSIRKSERAAAAAGVSFEIVTNASAEDARILFDRLIAVEQRSWKAAEDVGLRDGSFREFYRRMVIYLAPRGRLRLVFARLNGRDLAYCLGAVFAGTYRGLQFSYDDAHAALSLGSLCQLHQIRALGAERVASYDLGTEMDYKRRWAEGVFDTRLVIVQRS